MAVFYRKEVSNGRQSGVLPVYRHREAPPPCTQGTSRLQSSSKRKVKGQRMNQTGEPYLAWLLRGMKRLHEALIRHWNRQAPAEASQRETYTDQW